MARSASAANCMIDFEIAHSPSAKTHFFLKARCAWALRAITRSGTAPPHREGWVGTLPLCSLPKACPCLRQRPGPLVPTACWIEPIRLSAWLLHRYLLGRRLPLTPAFPSAARPLTARDPMHCAYHCLRPRKIGTRASGRLSLSRFPMPVVASTVAGNPDATATTDIVVAAALASRPQRRLHRPPRP